MTDIDFSTPYWLISYYHVIGTVSLMFDTFSIYLVLFKSSKIDNFRYFLLNFQIACSFTDIHITFLMQPVPLYPLMAGYALGFMPIHFGTTLHTCITIVIFFYIYQVASMIICFLRKHQAIARTLKARRIPGFLVYSLSAFLITYTLSVVGIYYSTSVPEPEKLEFVAKNLPEYLTNFRNLPNFSIYQANFYLLIMVIISVTGGILAFIFLVIILINIFRMLNILKTKISVSNYQKHRAAIRSLIAQFATSSVCFLPPISLVFVVFLELPYPQVIVEVLLVIACLHSSLNVIVLVITFPPYRKFVIAVICRREIADNGRVSSKPSVVVVSNLS